MAITPGRPGSLIALRIFVLLGTLTLLAHAVAQGVGAIDYWRPCFAEGFENERCIYLQYESTMPWWAQTNPLWLIELVIATAIAGIAMVRGRRESVAIAALIIVAASNPAVDYVLTPAFVGGYFSSDATPGFGMFGAVTVGVAGVLLPFSLARPRDRGRGAGHSASEASHHSSTRVA